jgi:phosphoribosylpyrophosphate synthetase
VRNIDTGKRKWHSGFELRLVPGMHVPDKQITKAILRILRDEFKLVGAQILETHPKNQDEDRYRPPDKKAHVLGLFPEGGVREDLGDITLSEFRRRESVFFITHPYNHATGVQVETTIAQMRSFGEMLLEKDMEVKHLGLVVPVGPYDLNHSVRRKAREGLVESYMLRRYLKDLESAGYNEIITIASHSQTTREEANARGISFRDIDPFRPEWAVPSRAMGPFLYKCPKNTDLREDYEKQVARLTPFVQHIRDKYGDRMEELCFVATDDGSEKTIDQLAYACRGDKQKVLAIIKERDGPGRTTIVGVKSSSTMELDSVRGKTCIIADDRRLSGGTTHDIAHDLKERYGAKEVVALIAHDISYDEKIRGHTSVDRFVFLETNPNSAAAQIDDGRVTRMPLETTALLLAGEIFDSYVTVRDMGKVKVR